MGLPVIHSLSFRKAIMEPENVTPPMKVPSMIVTPAVSGPTGTSVPRNSPMATRADAPPPKPLKRPTISGMAVIWTMRAATAPIRPPVAMPMRMGVQERISLSTTVAMMARNMAKAAMALPARAVAGDWSRFSPTTKRIADSR
jgi:hypothetical protein